MTTKSKVNEFLPWIEIYRPSSLDEVISHGSIIDILRNFIKNKTLPHLLFHGPSGTGKTSVITAISNEMYGKYSQYMVMEINASQERGIEFVRNKISQFAETKSMLFYTEHRDMFKLIILDEVDAMTIEAQCALRIVMEQYTENVRFCLICNYIEKINLAIQSRCVCLRFLPLKNKYVKLKIMEVCDIENIKITDQATSTLISRSNGDMRKILNVLQAVANYKNITEEIINGCLSYPCEKIINQYFSSLMDDTLEESILFFDEYENKYNFQLTNIITEIHTIIIDIILGKRKVDFKINQINVQKILDMLKDIEHNTLICISHQIQCMAFISLFKLYPINDKK